MSKWGANVAGLIISIDKGGTEARVQGMVGGGAPLVSFHVRPQSSDPESPRYEAFLKFDGSLPPAVACLFESGPSWISTPPVRFGVKGQKLEIA